jgi:hypothetical protein
MGGECSRYWEIKSAYKILVRKSEAKKRLLRDVGVGRDIIIYSSFALYLTTLFSQTT